MPRRTGGWWRGRGRRRPGSRLRLPARRRRHPAARPALAAGSPTACTGCPAGSTRPPTTGRDGAWTGRPLAGGVVYELHVGTFTPEGTLDAAIDRLDHLVELGVDFVELLPVNAFTGTHNWGYDGVALVRGAGGLRRPGGLPAVRRRLPPAGARRDPGRRLQPPRPVGQLPARVRPVSSPRAARNTWGNSINLDGPGSDEVRRYIIDNALMWLRDYPRRRAAAGRGARAGRRAGHPRAGGAGRRGRRAVGRRSAGRCTLIAESDLNDPRMVTPRVAGGLGLTAQWSDDFHHALHATLTGEGQGYYADFAEAGLGGLAKVLTGAFFHDGTLVQLPPPAPRPAGRHRDAARLEVPRLPAGPRPDRQPRGRRPDLRHPLPRPARRRRHPGAHQPVHPDAVHGRGVGRRARRGSSSPATPSRSSARPPPRAGSASSPSTAGTPTSCPTRRTRRPSPGRSWTGPSCRRSRTSGCSPCTAALIALRRAHPDLVDPDLRAVRWSWDDADRWLVVHRGSLRVVANLADQPREIDLDVAGGRRPVRHRRAARRSTARPVTLPAESAAVLTTR